MPNLAHPLLQPQLRLINANVKNNKQITFKKFDILILAVVKYQIAFYVKTVGQIKNLRPLCELTDEAGEGGPDPAPQKMKLSQKFRHLMRCNNYFLTRFSTLIKEMGGFVFRNCENSLFPHILG